MKLIDLIRENPQRNPIEALILVGGTLLFRHLQEKRLDRQAIERWEDEGGTLAPSNKP